MSKNQKLKPKVRVCRICGHGSSVRSQKCRCGGKLVNNLEKSIEAMLDTVVQERMKELQKEDAEVTITKAPLLPSQE